MKSIPSKAAQDVMYEQIKNAVYSDERYAKQTLITHGEDTFIGYDKDGQVFEGLKLE